MPKICCTCCGAEYPESGLPHVCIKCGGIFDYDRPFQIQRSDLEKHDSTLWQYQKSFGPTYDLPPISLGEGNTPLLLRSFAGEQLAFKMESCNPTGSYKDRGTTVLMTEIASRGIPFVVEDSSGNAGASLATYCSWAGIDCKIFVPESASGNKLNQISRSNAYVQMIPGPRNNATIAVEEAVRNLPAIYASHALQPFLLPGIATIAYELFSTFGQAPGTVIIPVGHGGLFLGIMRGFDALYQQKIISKMPLFIGVQAKGYHSFVSHFDDQKNNDTKNSIDSIAEGVRISIPSRYQQIIRMCETIDCEFVACNNDELYTAINECWKMGLYVEITSALVWAAFRKNNRKYPGPIVFIMTGSGLKY
ncbi:MAG: pyridoxal-phosphate dependent enzyme [Anaerolineaceae bacterium]|nr:pyridoxal-phosphate dependent enzyme [Anaerolineaceae bacterium]